MNDPENETVMVVSEKGYGKRSAVVDYRVTNRGGKGVKTLDITDKTGKVVAINAVTDEHDLMIINKSGTAIRLRLKDVRVQCSASAELSAFWRIADLAWDGLISDWTVLSKISTAKARVEQTDAQLMQALDQLQQTRRRVLERMNRA